MKVKEAIQNKRVLKLFFEEDTFPQTREIGRGGSGTVYEGPDPDQVTKIQPLRFQSPNLTEDMLYKLEGNQVAIIEVSLLEALVMENIHSPIFPTLISYTIFNNEGEFYSKIVMSSQHGSSYKHWVQGAPLKEKLQSWITLFEDLQTVYINYDFIHGDLNTANIFVDCGRLKLIDFGTSSFILDGVFYYPDYVKRKFLRSFPSFEFERTSAVDICKILFYATGIFSEELEEMLDTCSESEHKTRRLWRGGRSQPAIVIYHGDSNLTYERVLFELKEKFLLLHV
jgi:serine/threonine protein kinase